MQFFKARENDPAKNYFAKYYMPPVEIKNFNLLINNKLFFDQPIKNTEEANEKLAKMSRNKEYITGNVLDCLYHRAIINSLASIYQGKQIQAFLNKLISWKN